MKEILIQAFNTALAHYCNKADRGYGMGLFSSWRHSFSKTAKLAGLENALINSTNDAIALSIILEHLLSKEATFHNHSFNNYLIDELKKSMKHIDWDCFTPIAIKKYEGTLYRGTSQPPEKIFKVGFNELIHSDEVEDYLKFINGSVGISTSKSFDCAMLYAANNKRSGNQRYIYAINYRDDLGYDILETGKARGLSFHPLIYKDRYSGWGKREVNVQDTIHNTDIIGAWQLLNDGTLSWLDNPHYQLEKIASKMHAI